MILARGRRRPQNLLVFVALVWLGTVLIQYVSFWRVTSYKSLLPSRELLLGSEPVLGVHDDKEKRVAEATIGHKALYSTDQPKEKPLVVLGSGFGRHCNQLLILALGVERAMREGFRAVVPMYNIPVFTHLDVELFNRTFADHILLLRKKEDLSKLPMIHPARSYWCGLKINLDTVKRGIRPRADYRKHAEEEVARMRREVDSDTDLVSVHVRHYDGLCNSTLPDSCEWNQNYHFRPEPYGCNQTLTRGYLDYIRNDWPERSWKKIALYLSTDRQSRTTDESYTKGFRAFPEIVRMFEPTKGVSSPKYWNEYKIGPAMMQDMWVSVLTDFYVGMPRSSCDKIVAEWRVAEGRPPDRVHPRTCYHGYDTTRSDEPPRFVYGSKSYSLAKFEDPLDRHIHQLCPYVKRLGFDTTGFVSPRTDVCSTCKLILSFAAALSKAAAQEMGVLVYGDHGSFLRAHFDWEALHEAVHFVHVRETIDEPILHGRVHIVGSGKLRASGVKAKEQVRCAIGESLEALYEKRFIPNRDIREAVSAASHLKTARVASCKDDSSSSRYCAKRSALACESNDEVRDLRPNEYPQDWSFVHQLWAMAMADDVVYDPTSSCAQVVALWRRALSKATPREQSDCCIGNYVSEKSSESSALFNVIARGDRPVWECPG